MVSQNSSSATIEHDTPVSTDAAFAAFLAERPQIELDTGRRAPGACACPGRYRIGDKPILTRHDTGCDSVGGDPDAYTYWVSENGGHRIMRRTTLEALSGWIPVPPAPPEQVQAINEVAIRRMVDELHFHLVKLHTGTKQPMGAGWNDPAQTPALTAEQAIAHVADGGGLGVLLGPSRLVVVDCENAAATDLMMSLGFVPVIGTAKGMSPVCADPRADKRGGTHYWFVLPEGVDGSRLENIMQKAVGDAGGVVDVLAGPGRQAVVPPTALIEAGGWAYQLNGNSNVWDWAQAPVLPEVPAWLSDTAVACPAGFENLHGGIAPKQVQARGPQSEASIELSSEIDAIPWSAITALDARMQDWGAIDPECGCSEGHWDGADHARSYWLHDCGRGSYIHIVSGTMLAKLGIDGDEATLSKMQLACILRGVETTGAGFRSTAEHFGIQAPSPFGDFAEAMDEAAERYEDAAADPAQCTGTVAEPDPEVKPEIVSMNPHVARVCAWRKVRADREYWIRQAAQCRELARHLRGGVPAMQQAGETYLNEPMVGAEVHSGAAPAASDTDTDTIIDAEIVDETPASTAPTSPTTAPARDDAIQGVIVDDWEDGDQEMWNRHREIEAELRGKRDPKTELWTGMVPCLGRIANIAESRGIYMLGFTEACLPRVSAQVPANVLLTPRAEGIREKSEGVGMGYNSILLGPPATGKTTTQTAAAGAVPLPKGIRQCSTGSAEGVIKKARSVSGKGAEETIHATSVYVETDEIKSQNKDLKRDGSMYSAFINSVFFGGTMVGMTASEASRNADIPAHSTRFAQQIGAQPQLCGLLLDDAGSGITARFSWAFTGSVDEADLGPLYARAVPALLPNGLPWDPPVGIPFGFRPYIGPATTDGESDVPTYEIENIEDLPAEWIVVPRDPEEVAAARAESARRSRRTRVALTEDRETGRTSGHDFVRIEKTAALLAFMDGIKQPTEEYVAAAKLLAEATALAAAEAKVQSDSEDDAKAKKDGRKRGIEYATGNAVAKQESTDAVAAAADALYAKLTRPVEGVRVKGKLAKGFGGQTTYGELTAASCVRPEHRPHREAGMALLIQQQRIRVTVDGNDPRAHTVTAAGQIAAPAKIGNMVA